MNILIVTARYYPEQFSITRIAEELVKKGHNITVLTGKPNYGYWKILEGYENIKQENINGVNVIRVDEKPRTRGLKGLIKNYLSIYKEYKKGLKNIKGDFDIVLSHVISPIWTIAGIKKYCKKHRVPHVHYGLDLWPESLIASNHLKTRGLLFNFFKFYSKKLYKSCDYICFSSPSAEWYFHEYLKLKNIPFKHIYQPCLSTPPSKNEILNHVFLKNSKINILYCGTVGRFHKLNLLIEAINSYEKKNNIKLDIVGDGSELINIQNLVKKYNLENIVLFHGRVTTEETKKYMLDADILYLPLAKNTSTSNIIPQKLIEYLMYGKPIYGFIAGDGLNILETASKENIVCDETAKSLKKGLDKIVSMNSETLRKCGLENRDYYERNNRFKTVTICDELIDVMKTVVEKNKN